MTAAPIPAFALSEIKPSKPAADEAAPLGEAVDRPAEAPATPRPLPPLEGPESGPDGGLPDPAPAIRRLPGDDDTLVTEQERPAYEVLRDLAELPAPTARMRELIIQAARTGDIERLRALLGTGSSATQLSISGTEEDPIQYLKSISGDGDGIELLAIMLDVLDSGFVHVDEGGANDLYIWPYFVASDLNALTPEETVDLLRIVTAGDLEDMRNFGAYNFFRVGISPDGEWRFFISGD
ncbi:hypothetical protein E2A64_11295 [Pseudohoeflea suaedae]|uniref:Uncharacterized protein n=1 Tax=Pseudohoeflea suaedae TaxID=877384 RepID=A0A4R5PJY2_9HYPH|nr:hypothetical protein [Pseudohoeflea suaedae]TDH35895.1 hypothetical protein E2A64_11295 [Pseudohoeflea suaedae]